MTFDREQFLAETMLRIKIQKMLQEKKEEKKHFLKQKRAEDEFRTQVRQMIQEAKKSPVPYGNTGIAVLEDTIKKINPIIHDDFITLTTDVAQRKSFRAHIINGFRNALERFRAYDGKSPNDADAGFGDMDSTLLATPDMMAEAPGDELGGELPPNQETPQRGSEGVSDGDIDNDGIPDAEEKFIETDPEQEKESESPEDQELSQFTVDGEDETGRNMALQTFKKVEKTIVDAYNLLSNPTDKDKFYEFGIINLKLYFDRWEEELQQNIQEI